MANMREAERLNKTVRSEAGTGYHLLTASYMVREKGLQDSARRMVERAIGILEKADNKYYLAKAYYVLSEYYNVFKAQEFPLKKELVEKSVAAYQYTNKQEEKAFAMRMQGELYVLGGEVDKGRQVLVNTLALYDSIQYKELQGIYITLSDSYLRVDDFKQAYQNALLALKAAREVNDTSMQLCQINNILAHLYSRTSQKDKAIAHYKDALKTSIQNNQVYTSSFLFYNIAVCYVDIERPLEAIRLLKSIPDRFAKPQAVRDRAFIVLGALLANERANNTAEAGLSSKELELLLKDPGIGENLTNHIYRALAGYYYHIGDYGKTRSYLQKNTALSAKFTQAGRKANDEWLFYKLDSASGDFRSAFAHFSAYKIINDSLNNVVSKRDIQQLEVEYETTLKADSILCITV